MKMCWDNLNDHNFRLTASGQLRSRKTDTRYIEKESCKQCGEPFLAQWQSKGEFCSKSCDVTYRNKRRIYPKKKISRPSKIMKYGKHSPVSIELMRQKALARWEKDKGIYDGPKNPFYGRKHTKETRLKISEKHADVNGPNNPRYGNGDNIKGKKNPNWRNGLSCERYCLIWRNKEYVEYIKDRDKNKFCWNPQCPGNGNQRIRHHINYNKKNCDPNNIITICNSCNSVANFNRKWWQSFYGIVMEQRGICV